MRQRSGSLKLAEHIETLYTCGTAVGLTDRDLLEQFLGQMHGARDDAFRALVERHGPMVLRVCNQVLHDPNAADDAFQATFLVLAQHARSIRNRDSVASWLFGVATRSAARMRMMTARRLRYEQDAMVGRRSELLAASASTDTWVDLHEAIAALHEKYRLPIVLCYFEGLTHEQAAVRLDWPVGTVKTRLVRGRDRIKRHIENRNRQFATSILPAFFEMPGGMLAPSSTLVNGTVFRAGEIIAGSGVERLLDSSVIATIHEEVKVMFISKLRQTAFRVVGVAALGLSALAFVRLPSAGAGRKSKSDSNAANEKHSHAP